MYLKFITLLTVVTAWKPTQGDDATWRCENGLPDTTVVLGFQEKCFQFVDREVYWTSANNYCRLYGGRIVKIDDPHTNNFIVRSLNLLPWRNKGVWIGLHDRDHEHHWEWVNESNEGDRPRWTNWARGHPRAFLHSMRDCIRMVRGRHQDWKWHETFCAALNWKYKFICQYPMKEKTPPPKLAGFYQDNVQESDLEIVPKLGNARPDAAERSVKQTTVAVKETVTMKPLNGEVVSTAKPADDYEYEYTAEQKVDLGELIKPMALKEEKMENNEKITFVVLACTIGVISAVIILIIILVSRRRKRKQMEDKTLKIENPLYDSSCDNNNTDQGQRPRVQNEYVINVYSNPLPLAVRLLQARSAEQTTEPSGAEQANETEATKMPPVEGDGYEEPMKSDYLPMDGNGKKEEHVYDRPRSNVYSEIPELYSENVYETLDDIHMPKNESDA